MDLEKILVNRINFGTLSCDLLIAKCISKVPLSNLSVAQIAPINLWLIWVNALCYNQISWGYSMGLSEIDFEKKVDKRSLSIIKGMLSELQFAKHGVNSARIVMSALNFHLGDKFPEQIPTKMLVFVLKLLSEQYAQYHKASTAFLEIANRLESLQNAIARKNFQKKSDTPSHRLGDCSLPSVARSDF